MRPVLLTSFVTWKGWQASNSADDLLQDIYQTHLSPDLAFLRGLPVNLPIARDLTIGKIQRLQPKAILLCGMAETRQRLSLEAQAVRGDRILQTPFHLPQLTAGLTTDISDDAGRFVCNSLYYAILDYTKTHLPGCRCLFVHVPVLTPISRSAIAAEFQLILARVRAMP